ncbi:hypothetical protein RSAG8_09257, partial [Rhizoctonia solani AG-8 WAC10335]
MVLQSPPEKNFKLPPEFSGALRSALELSPLMGEITEFVEWCNISTSVVHILLVCRFKGFIQATVIRPIDYIIAVLVRQ